MFTGFRVLVILLSLVLFLFQSTLVYADVDMDCVVGGKDCKKEDVDKLSTCVCPVVDPLGFVLDLLVIACLPFKLLSGKPIDYFDTKALENVFGNRCSCPGKVEGLSEQKE